MPEPGRRRHPKPSMAREPEGGFRASEPGHLGEDHVLDFVHEGDELEGHNATGHDARDEGGRNAGSQTDLGPEEWTGADLDRRRRAAKRAETTSGRDPEEERRQTERYTEPA